MFIYMPGGSWNKLRITDTWVMFFFLKKKHLSDPRHHGHPQNSDHAFQCVKQPQSLYGRALQVYCRDRSINISIHKSAWLFDLLWGCCKNSRLHLRKTLWVMMMARRVTRCAQGFLDDPTVVPFLADALLQLSIAVENHIFFYGYKTSMDYRPKLNYQVFDILSLWGIFCRMTFLHQWVSESSWWPWSTMAQVVETAPRAILLGIQFQVICSVIYVISAVYHHVTMYRCGWFSPLKSG